MSSGPIRTRRSKVAADGKRVGQSREYAEAVFDTLPDPIAVMDLDGRIQHANRQLLHELGQTQEQVFGKTPSDLGLLGCEQFLQLKSEVVPKLLSEGTVVNVEATGRWPDGRSVPALLSFGLLRSDTGEPQAIVVSSRDVSLLKQAHEATAQKEEMLRVILRAIPESLLLLDAEGRVVVCNETAAKRVGRPVQELIGNVLVDCLAGLAPPEVREQRAAIIAQIFQSGQPVQFTDERNGLVFKHTCYPTKKEDDQVTGVVIFARDITKQMQTQAELGEYCERLRGAEQLASLGLLSATLVHELTQPLSVIQLATQTAAAELKKLPCPDAVRQDLEASLTACRTIAALIRRFREYTRRSNKPQKVEVDVSRVAEWTIRILKPVAQQAKVTIQTKNLKALPVIKMPENELEQIFFTLVQNAIQAADGREDRCLRIAGLAHDSAIELQFQDNCGGIEPAHVARIFDPLFTTKPLGKGTGLGLSIAHRIVQQKGGQISVQNRYGEGVTFEVTLPIE